MERSGRTLPLTRPLAVLVVVAAAMIWPAGSQAFVACSSGGPQLSVFLTAEEDSVTFSRFGDQIAVAAGDGSDGGEVLVPCSGGTPTVSNTDLVTVQQSAGARNGIVVINLGDGSFAPGVTPEADGVSEIEFQLNLTTRNSFLVILTARGGADLIQAGTTPSGLAGVNLNTASEPIATADPDVLASGAPLLIDTGDGPDQITGQGGPGFAGPLVTTFLGAFGGPGRDLLQAGPAGVLANGGAGRDRLLGSDSGDILVGGRGTDTILAGGGRDDLLLEDGDRDRVKCGPGKDRGTADRSDRLRGCEKVRRVRRHPLPGIPEDIAPSLGSFFSAQGDSLLRHP